MLTTTEVLVRASLLAGDCALVGQLIADVAELAATLNTTNGRTIRAVAVLAIICRHWWQVEPIPCATTRSTYRTISKRGHRRDYALFPN